VEINKTLYIIFYIDNTTNTRYQNTEKLTSAQWSNYCTGTCLLQVFSIYRLNLVMLETLGAKLKILIC